MPHIPLRTETPQVPRPHARVSLAPPGLTSIHILLVFQTSPSERPVPLNPPPNLLARPNHNPPHSFSNPTQPIDWRHLREPEELYRPILQLTYPPSPPPSSLYPAAMGSHAPQDNSIYGQLFSHSPSRDPYYHRPELISDPEDADDERSLSEVDEDDPIYRRQRDRTRRHNFGVRRNSNCIPQFPNQDVRPTSVKELAGWYSYAWAAEAFVICGVSSFIPVTLEQLARENGVVLGSDGALLGECAASENQPEGLGRAGGQCVVSILGYWVNTASFAM